MITNLSRLSEQVEVIEKEGKPLSAKQLQKLLCECVTLLKRSFTQEYVTLLTNNDDVSEMSLQKEHDLFTSDIRSLNKLHCLATLASITKK